MESRISGHTKLYCLIGSPVDHSGSPAMYNYSFARTGVDAAYLAFDIPLEQTAEGVAALKTLGVGGFNVTMPDKTAVAGIVDELSPAAKLIGACNTVTVGEDGRLTGHNTDGIGFVRNLREHGVEVRGQKLVVLGAGGAATAICVQAALDGAAEIAEKYDVDGIHFDDYFYPTDDESIDAEQYAAYVKETEEPLTLHEWRSCPRPSRPARSPWRPWRTAPPWDRRWRAVTSW